MGNGYKLYSKNGSELKLQGQVTKPPFWFGNSN